MAHLRDETVTVKKNEVSDHILLQEFITFTPVS